MNRFIPKSAWNSGDLFSCQLLAETEAEVSTQAVFVFVINSLPWDLQMELKGFLEFLTFVQYYVSLSRKVQKLHCTLYGIHAPN